MRRGAAMLRAASFALAALLLVACNDEAAQRKAFIDFLQTRILDKPGLHVPYLTPDEAKRLGDYARQYAIITDFSDGLDSSVARPMQQAMNRGAVRSLDELVTRHADFGTAREGIEQLRAAVDKQLAAADAAHAALKQPDDLRPVFDKAYERDVTVPAKAFSDVFPDLDAGLGAIIDLGEFIDRHKDKITITGVIVQTGDPALQPRLAALIAALADKTDAITKAQQRLRAVMEGS